MVTDYFTLLIGAILVNNFVLAQFLGLCPLLGATRQLESALGMALATTFVLTLTSACSSLVYRYVLLPLDLGYLKIIAFMLVIAAVVQGTELALHKANPLLARMLGIYLPLITVNCAILGLALISVSAQFSFLQALVYGLGAGAGFSLVLVLFAALRERLAVADVPAPFRGAAIGMITAGFASLAFMGFAGLV